MPFNLWPPELDKNGDPRLFPSEELGHREKDTKMYIGKDYYGEGELFLTSERVFWLPLQDKEPAKIGRKRKKEDPSGGIELEYTRITMSAIMQDKNATIAPLNLPSLYILFQEEPDMDWDGDIDEPFEENNKEIRFCPANTGELRQMFDVFNAFSADKPDEVQIREMANDGGSSEDEYPKSYINYTELANRPTGEAYKRRKIEQNRASTPSPGYQVEIGLPAFPPPWMVEHAEIYRARQEELKSKNLTNGTLFTMGIKSIDTAKMHAALEAQTGKKWQNAVEVRAGHLKKSSRQRFKPQIDDFFALDVHTGCLGYFTPGLFALAFLMPPLLGCRRFCHLQRPLPELQQSLMHA